LAADFTNLDAISTLRGTGNLSNGSGAYDTTKVGEGKTYTKASSSFLLYANSNKSTWAYSSSTVLATNALTELRALSNGRYVKLTSNNINYDDTATLLKLYIADAAATEADISKKMYFLDFTYN